MSPNKDDRRHRSGSDGRQQRERGSRGPITAAAGGQLPKWVRDEILRSTPKERRDPAINELQTGLNHYADERFRQALNALRRAKALAPRAATIRELLGLSAYHLDEWEEALRELRTFRRLTGETTQLPVEMDCLRALGRHADVEKTWNQFKEVGGSRDTDDEARVVYASHLLDRGLVSEAWSVIKPGRLIADPPVSALRRWAVAARVAAAAGDHDSARKLVDAIRDREPSLPWLEELERSIS